MFWLAALLVVAAGVVVVAGWLLVRPHRTVVGAPPPDLAAKPVTFEAKDGVSLSGWLVRGEPGRGALLLMHGIRASRRQMLNVARLLARERFTLLLFDFRAEGESEGERISVGFFESRDASAALDFLRREAPGEKVGAIGRSMGGAAALLGDGPLALDALVLESVYPDFEQATAARMEFHLGRMLGGVGRGLGRKLPPLLLCQLRFWLDLGPDQLRPVDAVARLRAPLLVLSGDRDRYLPVEEARRVFEAAPEPKEWWTVTGADHEELLAAQPAEYERRVVAFLRRWLR